MTLAGLLDASFRAKATTSPLHVTFPDALKTILAEKYTGSIVVNFGEGHPTSFELQTQCVKVVRS